MNKLYSMLKFLIGWPFSILAIFFIIKLIAPQAPTLFSNLQKADPILLFYGITCFIIFYGFRSYIWYLLLNQLGYDLRYKESAYLWATSELKRYIPGNIWSFLGRTVLFAEKGVKKKDIGKSLIIEAELFVLGSLIVAILSLPFIIPGFQLQLNTLSGFLTTLLITLPIILFVFTYKVISNKSEYRISKFVLPPYPPKKNAFLVFLSTLSLLFFGLGNYFIIGSIFPLHPQLILELTGFFVLAFVAGYLSILTPAGFGVREGIMFYGLTKLIPSSAAAFASVFSRIILVLSELIFIFLTYLSYRIGHLTTNKKSEYRISKSETNTNYQNKKIKNVLNFNNLNFAIISDFEFRISNLQKWISHHIHETIVLFLSLIYTLYFTITSFLRYDNFYTGRFDLGNMAQTVWNTSQGRMFLFSNPNNTEPISRLAFHADFILILLAPFYALWSNPKVLLLIQALVVSLGALFVYLIAKHIVKNKNLSLVFAFVYLINPSVQRANLYDFHAVTLATTFLLAAYYFFIKKKYWQLVLFALLAALCKEQIWAIIALFGVFLAIRQRQIVLGAYLFAVSAFMFYYLIWHAIPHAFGSQHFALSYYSDFGDRPSGIIKSLLFSPDKILHLVLQPERIEYLKQLFSPLGYLPFLAPLFLLFTGPDLAINLLSNNSQLHQIFYQYTATITPFLFIAAIWGARVIKTFGYQFSVFGFRNLVSRFSVNRTEKQKTEKLEADNRQLKTDNWLTTILILYILISSLSAAYSFGPLPGSQNPNIDMITKPLPNREFIESYLTSIPKKYKVTASNNLASHLSEREHIYVAPLGIDKADVAVLLLTDQWSLKNDTALVEKLKHDNRYHLTIDQHPFYVFTRNR